MPPIITLGLQRRRRSQTGGRAMMDLLRKVFGIIPWADSMIERAWLERNWKTFVQLWLIFTAAMAVVSIVVVLVPGMAYLEGMRLQQFLKVRPEGSMSISQFMAGQYSGLWNFALGFTAVTSLGALLTAVPVMLMKQLSGGFDTSR
jgi:ABC-type phosphate transport system permease subunit